MILQSLVAYYETLVRKGEAVPQGWQTAKVSYALHINKDGELLNIVCIKEEQELTGKNGKVKRTVVPRMLTVPNQVKRSSGVSANFLCDNITYMLGYNTKEAAEQSQEERKQALERAKKCFNACRDRNIEILSGVKCPEAEAVVQFFRNWDPDTAEEHPRVAEALAAYKDLNTANLVFDFGGNYVLNAIPEIVEAWESSSGEQDREKTMRCLVTGHEAVPARLHPSISGVDGAQSTGLSIVSFNAPAFESYGHDGEQGCNAPVSGYAAFAYGTALNKLLSDRRHRIVLGDMTVVFWAEDAESAYQDFLAAAFGGDDNSMSDDDIYTVMEALSLGRSVQWNKIPLHPDNRFYILGIAPNAARATIRLFLQNTFGELARNLIAHQKRMEIDRPVYDQYETISVWRMLYETVNQKSKDDKPMPQMASDVFKAVLTGSRYPATLYNQIQTRLRAGDKLTRVKAATMKAYLLRNLPQYEEVLQVKLNEETTYVPYVLGRLFAVLEGAQKAANPGINTTIRDRFFNAASCTPAVVFPQLVRLSQAHLKKMGGGLAVRYSKLIGQLEGKIDEELPRQMNLYDQGIFQIGYYHQTQKLYEKKEEPENV